MEAVLAFAVVLFLGTLLSEWTQRSVLSTAVLFLVAGFLIGDGVLNLVPVTPDNPVVSKFAELALFSVLFTDGMRVGFRDLLSAWRLPGRALLLGLPLTLVGTAVMAHGIVGLSWEQALLVGAILSPTDPVFAAAIVGREEIPKRLRHLLNVESGVNDGLALPIVLVLLSFMVADVPPLSALLGDVALGIALGAAVSWLGVRLHHHRFFQATEVYEPFGVFAIGLMVLALTSLTHANEYLAAFAAGVTVATMSPELKEQFGQFGDRVAELLKLAALLVFGALISPAFLRDIDWTGYVFAALVLLLARPLALALALVGSRLNWRERLTAAWFGPKGFASVVYGLLILNLGVPEGERLFHLVALVVVASILAHSSTDVVLARWFRTAQPAPQATP